MLGNWQFDWQSQKVECCPLALEIIALKEEEFDGTFATLTKHFHKDDLFNIEKVTMEMKNGSNSFSFRHRVNLPNDEVRMVEVCGHTVNDKTGNTTAIIGTNQDITSLFRLEMAHNESRARFNETFAKAAVGMLLVDMESRIVEANEMFCNMFNFQIDDLRNKPLSEFQVPTENENATICADNIKRMIKGEISGFTETCSVNRRDGSQFQFEVSSSVIKDDEGVPRNLLTQFIPS